MGSSSQMDGLFEIRTPRLPICHWLLTIDYLLLVDCASASNSQ
jgi:hypothetical protein